MNENFTLYYNFTSSNYYQPYEIRSLYVNTLKRDPEACDWETNVTPDCIDHIGNFTTECPPGVASSTITYKGEQIPVSNVTYFVGCVPSSTGSEDMCNVKPEDNLESCIVSCRYCDYDYDLIYNVTAPPQNQADCDLHFWFMQGTDWCKVFPTSEREDCAVGTPYADIGVTPYMPFTVTPLNVLNNIHLTNIISPTQYQWNIRCCASGHCADAFEPWNFTTACSSEHH